MADKIKLLAALLFAVAGVAGFYLLADSPTVLRVVSVLAGLIVAAATGYFTVPGRQFAEFAQESREEARKVVWPTRKETIQVTGVVILFVVLMALFLWAVDGTLFWLLGRLMGRGE
jgi:preprotein translocase subunit SecE